MRNLNNKGDVKKGERYPDFHAYGVSGGLEKVRGDIEVHPWTRVFDRGGFLNRK